MEKKLIKKANFVELALIAKIKPLREFLILKYLKVK